MWSGAVNKEESKVKAVHFGAGKIGRGFIGDLLHNSGYEIVFVDVNEKVNAELNKYHNYYLYIIEEGYRREEIDNVSALSPITQGEEVVQAIVDADLVTTAVLADNFPKIAGNLAKGLKARLEAGKTKINVIPCENALLCGDMLKKEIIATGLITEAEVDQIAAIPNTAVDRMVFGTQRDDRDGIEAGKDHELAVEVNKLVNPEELPIKGAEYTDNLQKYLERKLYTINCGHAWSGYVAHVMGYEIIQDYFADEKNVELTRSVMLEVAALLEAKHGFTHQEMLDYVNFAINRFLTPGISDPIFRISRAPIRKLGHEDRLVGPAYQCEERGLENDTLLKGIAAAFLFDVKEDEQSVELLAYVKEHGIEEAISHYTGIEKDSRMFGEIVKHYNELKAIKESL